MGARGARASPSTSSTARPSATSCCRPGRDRRQPRRRDRQARCPATASRSSTARGVACRPARPARSPCARPDPVMFLDYWSNPEATAAKFIGDWMTTGDQGVEDEDGYVAVLRPRRRCHHLAGLPHRPGRDRGLPDRAIRPCALAAAVGKPDPLRTEIVKAYVVLKHGVSRRRRRWPTRSSSGCASGCRRMNIRARSSSSTRCR